MTTSVLLTGLSDDAAARIRYWSELNGLPPGQYVERLLDVYERLRAAGSSEAGVDASSVLSAASLR